jgi:hypothetical protein
LQEDEESKEDRKILLKRRKIKNTEMLESLREEFGHNPESVSSSGIAAANEVQRALREEAEERRRFEEDRFVRLVCAFLRRLSLT